MMSFVKRSLLKSFYFYIYLSIFFVGFLSLFNSKKVKKQEFDVFASKNYSHLQNFNAMRSYVDKKKYHVYTLPNNLEVFIIVDPAAKGSSAGVSVNTGVMKEGEIYGLAHFTEHMLFLGSNKYPLPTYFVDYISQFNGKFNGFTDFDTTGFFFRVNPDNFEKSMDIFSRFFIDPLFDPKYIEKEINSVNSEFERNIQLDKKRREQVLHQTADPKSHYHRFTTGNTISIMRYAEEKGINLEEQVKSYYNDHYRADNMKLIVIGNGELDYYKKVVNQTFSGMKRHNKPYEWTDPAPVPFKLFNEGRFVFYQTINSHQELDIHIVLPDIHKELPNNFGLYFKTLINYKGKNSLRDILRKKGLSARLKCGLKKIYKGVHMLKIHLFLSNKGVESVDEIISIVFKYLKYLKHTNSKENLYNFVKRYYDIKFLFMKNKKDLMKYIKTMCQTYRKYPKKYLFTQHLVLHNYNKTALDQFADYFNLNNSVILLGNKAFSPELTTNYNTFLENTDNIIEEKEKWYGTRYSIHKIRSDFIETINKIKSKDLVKVYNHEFTFLQSYSLPNLISLIRTCKKEDRTICLREFQSDEWDLTPDLIANDDNYELWYKRDRTFLIAKVNYFNKFIYPFDINDLSFATKIRLITYAINHHFRHFFYNQKLKQNKFEIKSNSNGFSIRIFSFSENIKELSESFYKSFVKMRFEEHEFNLIKDEMKKDIIGQQELVPQLRAIVNFFTLILKDYIHSDKILQELETLTFNNYNDFLKDLASIPYVKSFIHGNIKRDEALRLYRTSVLNVFKPYPSEKTITQKDYKNFHADLSGYYIFREKLIQSYNINHAILNFYQIGLDNINNIILANLVKSLCGNIYFTQLRIKEQLGYTTKGKIFSEGNYLYYLIVIQGSTATPDLMDVRIENVVEMMREKLQKTDENKLMKYIKATEKLLGKTDISLNKRTLRLWDEIITKRGYFNLNREIKQATRDLSMKDVMIFFNTVFDKKLRKLSIQEFSSKVNPPAEKTNFIKGYKPKIIKNKEFFRNRNKFIIK